MVKLIMVKLKTPERCLAQFEADSVPQQQQATTTVPSRPS